MEYLVTFADGSQAVLDWETLSNWLMVDPDAIVSYVPYEPEVPPPPPEEPPLLCSILITAPDSAQQGETVSLSATITNNSPDAQLYKTSMYADEEFIGSIEDTIPGGSSRTYGGSFVMPAGDVTILVWVERWNLDDWVYDNSGSKVVSLVVPPPPPPEEPEFRGFAVKEYTRG